MVKNPFREEGNLAALCKSRIFKTGLIKLNLLSGDIYVGAVAYKVTIVAYKSCSTPSDVVMVIITSP
jgi:hypothetical protein